MNATVSVLELCQYLCFEFALLIGIVVQPLIMVSVFIRSFEINKKAIFVQLSGIGDVMVGRRRSNTTMNQRRQNRPIRSASRLQMLYKYETYVHEKLEKYQVQLLLLKFCQCFFHGIPQAAVQIYVYEMHSHVYADRMHQILLITSIATSGVAVLQFVYELLWNTRKRHCIEIFN